MRRPKKEIQLTSYDELLGLEESPEKSMNQVVEIDLEKLYPFKNHPFHVNDDEKMAETVESIKTYGVLTPALVRPRSEGGYEMISGHRRKRGCELCGKTTMPALVRNYTDEPTVVEITKTSLTDGKELEGAKLEVTDEDGKVVDSWTSGKEAHLIRIVKSLSIFLMMRYFGQVLAQRIILHRPASYLRMEKTFRWVER